MQKVKPQLIDIKGFTVIGLSERTQNSDEFNPQTAKIPGLWQKFHTTKIPMQKPDSLIYGVYSDYESDDSGFYTVTAGVENTDLKTSGKLEIIHVKKGKYLVFENTGSFPQAIIDTWQAVWNYFKNPSNFSRTYDTDFEVYTGNEQFALYIGIKS